MTSKPLSASAHEASATQRAYLTLRRMILVGELQPGKKLKIEDLRALLDMGGSPVREALSLLVSDQLVERLDQRGFRTAEISNANFTEVMTLRCLLEERALRESIAHADAEWEHRLVIAHHQLTRQQRAKMEYFEDLHKDFHIALLAACPSPVLLKFCNQLYDLMLRYRYLAGETFDYSGRDIGREHSDIMNAAIDRDADTTWKLLLSHYRSTGSLLEQHYPAEAAQ